MANNNKFRQDMAKIINKTKEKGNVFVRKLCLELDASMVRKSPVDTGRFKGNWNVSFNAPDTSTAEVTDTSGTLSIAKAQAVLSGSSWVGSTVFITNSLPYAYRLEYEGWSNQAPQGMVRITLAEMNSTIQKVGLEVKAL